MKSEIKNEKYSGARLWLGLTVTLSVAITGLCLVVNSAWNAWRRSNGERATPDAYERLVFKNLKQEQDESDKRTWDSVFHSYQRETQSGATHAEREELERLYYPYGLSSSLKPSWKWDYLLTGDRALIATICTDFRREFYNTFQGSYSRLIEASPEPDKVVNEILGRLFEDLARSGAADARGIVADIADFVSEKYGASGDNMTYRNDLRRWAKGPGIDLPFARRLSFNPERERFDSALKRVPAAYALYFESLFSERPDAVKLMDRLIALQPEHACSLHAVAKYRRARLLMSMEDWDVLSDDQAKARVAGIKRDLRDVRVHVDAGALNPSKMSESAPYWIAYCQSMILRPDRLVRIDEADFAAAFRTYLNMPQMSEGNAVNSCLRLASHLASSKEVVRCASDPMLRDLITIYYSSDDHYSYNDREGRHLKSLWLDAIGSEPGAEHYDPTKLALLQYQVGRWTDCFATAGLLRKSDPLRSLLRSRCVLRLTGDVALARRILDAGLGIGSDDHALPKQEQHGFQDDGGRPIYVNLSDPESLRARLEGERAMVALSQGDFAAAYIGFHRSGSQEDAEYVGECLLTTQELRQCVLTMTREEIGASHLMEPSLRNELNPKENLITKLYRDGQVGEAVSLMKSPMKERAELYLKLIAVGEDEGVDRRSRASAYWRAANLAKHLGNRLFRSPVGAYHSSRSGWYMPYSLLPMVRYSQGQASPGLTTDDDPPSLRRENLLFKKEEYAQGHPKLMFLNVSATELRRVTQWMEKHLVRERLAERDPDYEVMRLALLAVRLLPDNDEAGSRILQHVGRTLKYKDPKGAEPVYRILATRFKQTFYGNHAFKRRWLSDDFTYPGPYILEER